MGKMIDKTAAQVTIYNARNMTPKGRKQIANWLRSRAKLLEKDWDLFAYRFTSKYMYTERASAKRRRPARKSPRQRVLLSSRSFAEPD